MPLGSIKRAITGKGKRPDWIKNPPPGRIVKKAQSGSMALGKSKAKSRIAEQVVRDRLGLGPRDPFNVEFDDFPAEESYYRDRKTGEIWVMVDTQGVKFRTTLPEDAKDAKG